MALADHEIFPTIEEFLRDVVVFESSKAFDAALEKVGEADNLEKMFETVLKHRMVNMDGALKLMLFLRSHVAPDIDDDRKSFSPKHALDLIITVFDMGVAEFDKYFDESDDESEEGDEAAAERA